MRKLIVLCAQKEAAQRYLRMHDVPVWHRSIVYVLDDYLFAVKGATRETATWVDLGGGNAEIRKHLRLALGEPLDPDAACWALKQVA